MTLNYSKKIQLKNKEMDCKLIGAKITTTKSSERSNEGIIVDKAIRSYNGASETIYVCMRKDGSIFCVCYNEIKEIKEVSCNTNSEFAQYLRNYKN